VKFTVLYSREAERALLAFPAKVQRQLAVKIARLSDGFAGDIKKLQASDNIYRLRAGNVRILFELEGSTLVIRTIRDRKNVYD
jgi:mRNA-degrading endonuclease RelE of RelBE toxin-antitoxin system